MIGPVSARTSLEAAPNQLRTSSESTSVMEFGFNCHLSVLSRRVANTRAATSDPQHCWGRVCLPARQCTSTSCILVTESSFCAWDTPVYQSLHAASQQSWPRPGLRHDAESWIRSSCRSACWDMGWISAESGGRCAWSMPRKSHGDDNAEEIL